MFIRRFPFFLAQRYWQTPHTLVRRIGRIASLSIGISVLALLLILSIFNGLEGVIQKLCQSFDPDLKIECKQGKTFVLDPELKQRISAVAGVACVVEVLEDDVLLSYRGRQVVAKLKGVSDDHIVQCRLSPFIVQGAICLQQQPACAIVGRGIQQALAMRLTTEPQALAVLYPHPRPYSLLTPLCYQKSIRPSGVFAVEKSFDDHYVIAPLAFATALMGKLDRRTAVEIQVAPDFSIAAVQQALQALLPTHWHVRNSHEQRATLLQVLAMERLIVFGALTLLLLLSSGHIFFILSILILTKKKDIAILYALGATAQDIVVLFVVEGLWIALRGAVWGILAAGLLMGLQQAGCLSVGTQTGLFAACPMQSKLRDWVYTAISVVGITLIAAYQPARAAAKTKSSEYL